ncbi:MAG: response regulator [Deltaproteobacteria bacterium]|nr:response regulator [Deltaproteobacteria bacterium]
MKKRILIVEDNPDLLTLLQMVLNQPYETIHAANGKEAIESASSRRPDLILMDILIPEIDGLKATRLIRKNPRTRSIPILALTAVDNHKTKTACLESGCNDYILKPFTPSHLVESIEKLLI